MKTFKSPKFAAAAGGGGGALVVVVEGGRRVDAPEDFSVNDIARHGQARGLVG